MKTSEKLKMIREEMLLTQEEFAELIGTSKSAVGHWEADGVEPNRNTLRRVAKALGYDEASLKEGTPFALKACDDDGLSEYEVTICLKKTVRVRAKGWADASREASAKVTEDIMSDATISAKKISGKHNALDYLKTAL